MKNDISAIGNALVDTVFKVPHELITELGLEIDQMTLSAQKSKRLLSVDLSNPELRLFPIVGALPQIA